MKELVRHRVRAFIAEKGEPSIPEMKKALGLTIGQVVSAINALRQFDGLNVGRALGGSGSNRVSG